KMDVAAARYNYFKCTLRGSGDQRGPVVGTLYAVLCTEQGTEQQQQAQFKWNCDGMDRPVIVPLWMLPGWGGRLIEIRLAPIEHGVLSLESGVEKDSRVLSRESGVGVSSPGLTVHIASPMIVGSLSSLRGP